MPHDKPNFNEIYIKGSRPLAVYKKHANKVLIKHNCIILHAMTAAIDKAVKLYIYLLTEYPYLTSQVVTDSVPTVQGDSSDVCIKEKSAIHIILSKVKECRNDNLNGWMNIIVEINQLRHS